MSREHHRLVGESHEGLLTISSGRVASRSNTSVDPKRSVLINAILGEDGVSLNTRHVGGEGQHGVLIVDVTRVEVTVSVSSGSSVGVVVVTGISTVRDVSVPKLVSRRKPKVTIVQKQTKGTS